MLEYNEIKEGKVIIFEGEPYEVLTSHVFRKQQRKPVNATKMRNVISGRVVEYSFHQSEKATEADLRLKPIKYLYNNRGQMWFCEVNDPSKRFFLPSESMQKEIQYLKPNDLIDARLFDEKIIGLKMPIKVELRVTEAAPGVKGDSSKSGNKQVVLETGAVANVPLFVNQGDVIRINTESGDYVERVDKK